MAERSEDGIVPASITGMVLIRSSVKSVDERHTVERSGMTTGEPISDVNSHGINPVDFKPRPVVIRILTMSAISAAIISCTTDIARITISEQELYPAWATAAKYSMIQRKIKETRAGL